MCEGCDKTYFGIIKRKHFCLFACHDFNQMIERVKRILDEERLRRLTSV